MMDDSRKPVRLTASGLSALALPWNLELKFTDPVISRQITARWEGAVQEVVMTPMVTFDEAADVLYVKRPGARLVHGTEAPHDVELILNFDERETIAGVQMIGAQHLGIAQWSEHPDRKLVPQDIIEAIDGWFLTQSPR